MPQVNPPGLDALRASFRPEYASLPAEDVEALVEPALAQLPGSTADDFWNTLNSIGRAAAPVLERAAPAMMQGAASGAPMGPYGMLAGAGLGLVSSAIGPQARPAAAPTPRPAPAPSPPPAAPPSVAVAPPPASAPAPPPPPAGAPSPTSTLPSTATPAASQTPAALPSGAGAAATFVSLLNNPAVRAAMLSQVAPAAGRSDVPAPNGASLPRGAINSLLMQLLSNATEALPEAEAVTEQEYLRDEAGEFLVDPASPEQQAALVLAHLQRPRPASIEAASDAEWFQEFGEADTTEWIAAEDLGELVSFY